MILQIHDLLESRLRQRDPDSTPLHAAVRRNQIVVVQLLLEHGANPAARDHFGLTPLHTAAVVGNMEVNVDSHIKLYSLALCFEQMDSFFLSYMYTLCISAVFWYFAVKEPHSPKRNQYCFPNYRLDIFLTAQKL